uniref:dihydroorotase n=1 Tax=Rhizochromulina marina TaxID=1034831 RepID=A0A7S2WTN6_9STRA
MAAQQFKRAIIMPNLKPPVVTTEQAMAYRERILSTLPPDTAFQPLMTLYMTDQTSPEEIRRAKESGIVFALKLYPAGATTNSDNGVTDLNYIHPALEAMEEVDLPLLVHGEVTDPKVDIFDREAVFVEKCLKLLVARYPKLRFVMEHITTKQGVDFVKSAPPNVAGTITAHHLLFNRNALLVGGIKPHMYCLPILKAEEHRLALLEAATSGSPKFFLGTDSAPHPSAGKHCESGCAGVFTAHAAIQLYAEAFASVGFLENLEAFCSFNGPDFYGLPRNTGKITLRQQDMSVPRHYPFGDDVLVPLRAGSTVPWSVVAPSGDGGSGK